MSDNQDHSLISLLDDIAQTIKEAKSRFPGSSLAAVDRDYVLDLVYSAREIVPDQLARADELLADAEQDLAAARADGQAIIDKANKQADSIRSQAREQAAQLIAEDAVTVAARSEAARIVDEARSQADKLRQGANDYSDQVLAGLSTDLARTDGAIEEILAALRKRFDTLNDQIEGGRAVIAQRLDEHSGLRPHHASADSDGGDDMDYHSTDIHTEQSQELFDDALPADYLAPDDDQLSTATPFMYDGDIPAELAETAPEPLDEDYR